MPQLTAITLDNGAVIYVERADDIIVPNSVALALDEDDREEKGGTTDLLMNRFQAMKDTIQTYTQYTLDAFQGVTTANVDKVTLEFGIKVAGEMGVPYVTKGTAESNLKITVECSFPKSDNQK